MSIASHDSTAIPAADTRAAGVATTSYAVSCASVVFRVVREQLCVGLPVTSTASPSAGDGVVRRGVPSAAPDASLGTAGLDAAARLAALGAVPARDLVRVAHAGVRVVSDANSNPSMQIVSWAIARPLSPNAPAGDALAADEVFVPMSSLPALDAATRGVLSCAFESFLDATLADALTRRLLPRHVLFRKTDGFGARSPLESSLGAEAATPAPATAEVPIFVGLLPDPFPLSTLRELYEHLLGAPLDRGNFRRQFHEIIDLGPIKALPIFERGVPHRAGQLFTFDRLAWTRFASRGNG
jgi:hypothetical protein